MGTKKYIFLLTLFFFKISIAQEPKDQTLYSQSQAIDTSIKPDYFQVEIGICEFYQYSGKKKFTSTKIDLDSVKRIFMDELLKLGVTKLPALTKISGRDYQTYTSVELFLATYELSLSSIDSIEILYRSLVADMPIPSLRRIKVTPVVTQENIKKAQIALEATALERAKIDAKKFADSNKVTIQKIENYQLGFIKKERFDSDFYNEQNKAINISYANPVYTLNVFYTFKLK